MYFVAGLMARFPKKPSVRKVDWLKSTGVSPDYILIKFIKFGLCCLLSYFQCWFFGLHKADPIPDIFL